MEKYNQAQIIPSIMPTPNGDYALLYWRESVDRALVDAIVQGKSLGNYCLIGLSETPYGTIPWILSAIGTVDEFSDRSSELFWFDFILNPGDISDHERQWLKILETQSVLNLGIPLGGSVRLNGLIDGQSLRMYRDAVKAACDRWHIGCDYRTAVEWAWKNELDDAIKQAMDDIPKRYGRRDKQAILSDCLGQAAARGLDVDHPLCKAYEEGQIRGYLYQWRRSVSTAVLSDRSPDPAENLKRDWLFASLCLAHSEQPIKIAVGSVSGTWIWADMPYKDNRPETLYLMAGAYRYLLKRNWKSLLGRNDALLRHLDLSAIAQLGKVPERKAFDQVGKILQGAVLDREFAILQPTVILVGKQGLEEIEYHPLAAGGLRCLFKVMVSRDATRQTNLVLVGELDASAGKIEMVGIESNPQVKLILFLVAIAYRDILVARHRATVSSKGRGGDGFGKSKSRHSSVKLVARVKQTKSQMKETFADPKRLVDSLQRYSTYLRSCHLRRLHEGWKASEKAIAIADQYKWLVPEGYTFVQPALVVGDSDVKVREEFKSISLMDILFD